MKAVFLATALLCLATVHAHARDNDFEHEGLAGQNFSSKTLEEKDRFFLPVACNIGENCYIQNFVDVLEGPGYQDYQCGTLSYPGHDGVDFRLANLKEMAKGVDVIAAQNGTVIGRRDGMKDLGLKLADPKDIDGKECGNGVMLEHESGLLTQYCHLKEGSVIVKKGDTVKTGQKIGKIGLSGKTEFPHLHFAVRIDKDRVLDPFTAFPPESLKECGIVHSSYSMWRKEALLSLHYQPTAILSLGVTDSVPNVEKVREGAYDVTSLPSNAAAVIFWVDIMGAQKDDVMEFVIESDSNYELMRRTLTQDAPKAVQFYYVGNKKDELYDWRSGNYTATFTIKRMEGDKETEVAKKTTNFVINK